MYITMDNVMTNGFCELDEKEMMVTEGGGILSSIEQAWRQSIANNNLNGKNNPLKPTGVNVIPGWL